MNNKSKSESKSEKWKVSFEFKFNRTIDELSDNDENANLKTEKNPSRSKLYDYLIKEDRYLDYLKDLFLYGEYAKVPEFKNFYKKNNKITFVLDKTNKSGEIFFPDKESIIDNLENNSLSDGMWEGMPGSCGVYPSSIDPNYELGVINFDNIKVRKVKINN